MRRKVYLSEVLASLSNTLLLGVFCSVSLMPNDARGDWWPEGWYGDELTTERPGYYPDLEGDAPPFYWDTGGAVSVVSIAIIRFYQTSISQIRKGNCPFHPSCSRYALHAIIDYGPFWGWLMAVDRIFYRENTGIYNNYPRLETPAGLMPYAPPRYDYIWEPLPWPLLPNELEGEGTWRKRR